jgi:hypothetical protein
MRGFGSPSICSEVRTPSPQPSPLWGEGVFCASFRVLAWQAPPFPRRVLAPEFFLRNRERIARQQKYGHVKRETGPVQGKGGWGLFRYAVSSFRSPD